MTQEDLQRLGLSVEDIATRVVDRLVEQFTDESTTTGIDFVPRVEKAIKAKIDERIEAALQAHVLPKITAMVDDLCLQETNKWGEAKKEPVTFVEYLVGRVDAYIREPVNYAGKAEREDRYNWTANTTRIAYMIHEHLQYNVSQAMKQALGDANASVRKGLEEAVKIALSNISVRVNTEIKT